MKVPGTLKNIHIFKNYSQEHPFLRTQDSSVDCQNFDVETMASCSKKEIWRYKKRGQKLSEQKRSEQSTLQKAREKMEPSSMWAMHLSDALLQVKLNPCWKFTPENLITTWWKLGCSWWRLLCQIRQRKNFTFTTTSALPSMLIVMTGG